MRNKLKRRLRELVRQELLPQSARADVVIRCRPGAYARDYDALRLQIAQVRDAIVEQFGPGSNS
jgi:ribonuclease P protein component